MALRLPKVNSTTKTTFSLGEKIMKQLSGLFLVAAVLITSLSAKALSGKNPPRNDGSGSTQCAWYDSGKKEEHGNHLTLDECNKHHGNCSQRCFVYEQVCSVEGLRVEFETISQTVNGQIIQRTERKDVTRTFTGRHRDQFRAREIADRECLMAHPRQDSCRMQSCHEDAVRVN